MSGQYNINGPPNGSSEASTKPDDGPTAMDMLVMAAAWVSAHDSDAHDRIPAPTPEDYESMLKKWASSRVTRNRNRRGSESSTKDNRKPGAFTAINAKRPMRAGSSDVPANRKKTIKTEHGTTGPSRSASSQDNPKCFKKPGQGSKGSPRLRPEEEGTERNGNHSERFCWNLGYWLQELFGKNKTEYDALESYADGLFTETRKLDNLLPGEQSFIKESMAEPEYRNLRARIMIGFACICEHNIRGNRLNEQKEIHIAVRPAVRSKFRFINMGVSQAQLICFGVDVKKPSSVFKECQKLGYLPENVKPESWTSGSGSDTFGAYFSQRRRREVYKDLQDWYHNRDVCIPEKCRFVIRAPEEEEDDDDDGGGKPSPTPPETPSTPSP